MGDTPSGLSHLSGKLIDASYEGIALPASTVREGRMQNQPCCSCSGLHRGLGPYCPFETPSSSRFMYVHPHLQGKSPRQRQACSWFGPWHLRLTLEPVSSLTPLFPVSSTARVGGAGGVRLADLLCTSVTLVCFPCFALYI